MSYLKGLFKGCLTVPNLLSLIRIILVPVFAVLFYQGHVLWAVFVLFLSGLSDFFDGKIARRFHQVSALGRCSIQWRIKLRKSRLRDVISGVSQIDQRRHAGV